MNRARRARRLSAAAAVATCALPAFALAARPAAAAAGPEVLATASTGAAALVGDRVARRWQIDPGSGGPTALDAGATTTSLTDPVTGREQARGGPDFTLTLDGVTLSSATGWSSVVATAADVVADPGHGAGPDGLPPRDVTFTYTRGTPGSALVLTRSYRLAPGDAMVEVRSTLRSEAPATLTDWSLDQVATGSVPGPAHVVELHSGSSYTSRHRADHLEPVAFDDQGELAVLPTSADEGVVLVAQRRAGPSSRMTGTVQGSGRTLSAVVEPDRELAIVPVESVTGSDTDNALPNPAYPTGGRAVRLAPGQPLDLGAAYLGVFHGGEDAAAAVVQRHLAGSVLVAGPTEVQQNTFHPFNDGNGMTADSMLAQAAADRALGVRTLVLDDGWQGGPHGLAGDWRLDPAKFPDADGDGQPDLPGQLRAGGTRLGLWLEALLFSPASDVYRQHPDWACAPTGDASAQIPDSNGLGYWDATNNAWQDYMTGVVDRLVATGATEFKLDNEQWMDCGSHSYTDYERAWEALVARWQARHPEVLFQLDETIDERSYPYAGLALGPTWFEDDHVKSTSHPGATQLSQELSDLWQTTPWVPPSTMGLPLFHDTLSGSAPDGTAGYQLPFVLLGQATLWRDTKTLSPADAAETHWWTDWYAAHRGAYTGLVLRDSETDPIDGMSPVVLQPWDHELREGFVTVVRQGGGAPGPQTLAVRLRDVDPGRAYLLSDVRTGTSVGSFTGAALSAGVPVVLADRYRTRVLQVSAVPEPVVPEAPLPLLLPLAALLVAAGGLGVSRRRTAAGSRPASGRPAAR